MTSPAPDLQVVIHRLEKVERQNRRLKHTARAVLLALAGAVMMGNAQTASKSATQTRVSVSCHEGHYCDGAPIYSQQHEGKTPNKLPELMPKKPECGLFLPARDERHDLARLVRSEQFLECERDGFPKDLAPPWKTSEEGEKKLNDACEYFAGESARDYPQVGQENIKLAADRCYIEVLQITLAKMVQGLTQP